MAWPELVPNAVCKTPIEIYLEDGINEDGSPKKTTVYSGTCNYSEQTKHILDAEQRLIRLSATALCNGDIAPGKDIAGMASVNNGQILRRIHAASKARNPDGTVNYTKVELL